MKKKHNGFAAITAIFVLVILASLSSAILFSSTTQQTDAGKDALGSRAYWAARSGLEWGITSASANSNCSGLPGTLTLDGFSVNVSCSLSSYTEAGSTVKILTITSTSQQGASGGMRVERSLVGSVEK